MSLRISSAFNFNFSSVVDVYCGHNTRSSRIYPRYGLKKPPSLSTTASKETRIDINREPLSSDDAIDLLSVSSEIDVTELEKSRRFLMIHGSSDARHKWNTELSEGNLLAKTSIVVIAASFN
nr:hypothetical protein Iba_scaffold14366CG0030 [Ipomoea batatas]